MHFLRKIFSLTFGAGNLFYRVLIIDLPKVIVLDQRINEPPPPHVSFNADQDFGRWNEQPGLEPVESPRGK